MWSHLGVTSHRSQSPRNNNMMRPVLCCDLVTSRGIALLAKLLGRVTSPQVSSSEVWPAICWDYVTFNKSHSLIGHEVTFSCLSERSKRCDLVEVWLSDFGKITNHSTSIHRILGLNIYAIEHKDYLLGMEDNFEVWLYVRPKMACQTMSRNVGLIVSRKWKRM